MTEGTLRARVATVLGSYRIRPQATTGVSPSELFRRRIRTRVNLLILNTASHVETRQSVQKKAHDMHSSCAHLSWERVFTFGTLAKGKCRFLEWLRKPLDLCHISCSGELRPVPGTHMRAPPVAIDMFAF